MLNRELLLSKCWPCCRSNIRNNITIYRLCQEIRLQPSGGGKIILKLFLCNFSFNKSEHQPQNNRIYYTKLEN